MRLRRFAVTLVVLLLPGVMLAPAWRLGGLGAGEDDVLYYYPTRSFYHDTVGGGHLPWFNPWTGLGRPFAADPQTAIWYPFTWLFAVLPPQSAYPISLWAHYSLALWGMYRLLRTQALGDRAAILGAVAFAFCGFMLAHRAHFTMQHAAAWAPWVFRELIRYTLGPSQAGATGRKLHVWRLASAAVVLALQCFAGHVQVAAITALGSLVFLLACGSSAATEQAPAVSRPRIITRWTIAWICAAGLFAVQWLPTLAYVRQCTRADRTYTQFTENSWHPMSLLGWVLPMVFGQRTPNFFDQPYWAPSHQVEQFSYGGVLPLLLAAVALRGGWRADPRRRPWIVLGVFGILLALGTYGPICPLLYWLPGSSLFRVPARALVLVSLAMAALAALAVDDLSVKLSPRRAQLRAIAIRWTQRLLLLALLLVGIPMLVLLVTAPLFDTDARGQLLHALRPWSTAIWVPLLATLVSGLALRFAARRWRRPGWLWVLVALTAIDLGVIGWTIDVPAGRHSPSELVNPQRPADWMDAIRESSSRLWTVTSRHGRLPGEYHEPVEKAVADTNLLRGIESLTDYGPLQPRTFVQRFGFEPWGETDRVPELLADTRWMRACNVGWVLVCDPLPNWPAPADCEPVTTTAASWRLYHYPDAGESAWLEPADCPGVVRFERSGPSTFTTWVDTWPARPATRSTSPRGEPGDVGKRAESAEREHADDSENWPRVVVSQLALPGWTARMDGRRVPIESVHGLLAGVRVPPGKAVEITWSYSPPGLVEGAGVTLLSIGAVAIAALRRNR